jgi:predicted nucleic acid-binding protein
MIKVYLNANILIALLNRAEKIHEEAKEIMRLQEQGKFHLYCNSTSLIVAAYKMEQWKLNSDQILENLRLINEQVEVVNNGQTEIDQMLNDPWKDLEDAHQHACAVSIAARYIVTNDQKFMANSRIPALRPKAFLERIQE